MDIEKQKKTPLLTAMKNYVDSNPIPFDVPGHKMGRLHTDLTDLIGEDVFRYDINAPIGIDNLYKGTGVIKESSDLLADAFGADESIFLINGTTSGIMMMIMGTVRANEKIILPRNVHKSVINALIVSGGQPVFVDPEYDQYLGIANGVKVESYVKAMENHPDAVAVFVINPTYFGIVSDLKRIVEEAHAHHMVVLADEAHGAHLAFYEKLPLSAMQCGADMSAVSLHKTAGSLTQSSALLMRKGRIPYSRVLKIYTMFGSTSPSHILLASIDAARKKMALEGHDLIESNLRLANYARKKLQLIPGVQCLDSTYCKNENSGKFGFDSTRLVIQVRALGLSGFEVFHILKDEYNVQVELAEMYLVLAILAVGSTKRDIDTLIAAFEDLSKRFYVKGRHFKARSYTFDYADIAVRPREAYHAPSKVVTISEAEGEISCESVMVYPPGIPLFIPGEVISKNIVKIYNYYLSSQGTIMQDSPVGTVRIIDKARWSEGEEYDEI